MEQYSPKTILLATEGSEGAKAVAEVAEEGGGTGLLVVGSRGLGTGGRMLLGSVSTKVLMAVSGPVLVCPREERDEGGRRP
jgi:nucleotide-binding universal stress UspA family protein